MIKLGTIFFPKHEKKGGLLTQGMKSNCAQHCAFSIFLLASLFLSGCIFKNDPDSSPSPENKKPSRLISTLETAGANRKQLKNFLDFYRPGSVKAEDARFLVSNLPPADRASMHAKDLKKILDYARLARKTLPWGPSVPQTIFRHFVLPHRVAHEPYQPCRKRLFTELSPLVSNCTMQQAVTWINRWCLRKTSFQTTSRWDQGPLTTIKRGVGRCEETSILLVQALRSVGIPARMAGTPAWQHTDSNHVWVEVWIKGDWFPLEAAQPYKELTDNRFRAPIVRSIAYGNARSLKEPIISRTFGATVINRTPAYATTWDLSVQLTDKEGRPMADTNIFISVFNYACFRPVARLKTDKHGHASVSLGRGSFLLTVRAQGRCDYSLVKNIHPDKRKEIKANLTLRRDRKFSREAYLPFHHGPIRGIEESQAQKITPFPPLKNPQKREQDRKKRENRFQGLQKNVRRFLQASQYKDLSIPLKKAGFNALTLARVLDNTENTGKTINYLQQLQAKDLATISYRQAYRAPSLASQTRRQAAQAGINYDNSTYENYVLTPRVEYEPLSFWRPLLQKKFGKQDLRNREKTLHKINRFVAALPEMERGFFGPVMTPEQVMRAGRGTDKAKRIFTCAALRSTGIPSRYNPEYNFVEYLSKDSWKPLFPDHPQQLGRSNSTAESKNYFGPSARVDINFVFNSTKLTGKGLQYFKDFSIAEYTKKGYYRVLKHSIRGSFPSNSTKCRIYLPAGQYWLFAGKRNTYGEPTVTAHKFRARPNQKTTLDIRLKKRRNKERRDRPTKRGDPDPSKCGLRNKK